MRKNAKQKFTNELSVARISRGLSRKAVARMLGYTRTAPLTHFEHGFRLPNLARALQLEIIYRRPVAFLFPELYLSLRDEIRVKEAALKQQTLF